MGMGEFNASKVRNMAQLASPIIGLDLSDFLADPRVAVDITPAPKDITPCTLGISKSSRQTCNQVFYMPGTFRDPELLKNNTLPHADLIIVHDIRGYELDFNALKGNISVGFDLKKDCDVYGSDIAAFQICLRDDEDRIAMQISACFNSTDASKSTCLSDIEWQNLPCVSSSLKINVRPGTVGFSRLNSTIQTYNLANNVQPANIVAAKLLDAFHGLFTGRGRGEDDEALSEWTEFTNALFGGLTGQVDMAPIIVAMYFATGSLLYGTHNIEARNAMGLYSLVAKVLWWCSLPLTETLSAVGTGMSTQNLTDTLQRGFENGRQATYSLATSTYELVVGENTIIAYGVLGGLVLIFCLVALCFSMSSKSAANCLPSTTSYPDLDYPLRLEFRNLPRIPTKEQIDWKDDKLVESSVTLRDDF